MSRHILISFDVEEFDMPLEYKWPISADEQLEIGYRGTEVIGNMITDQHIRTTLFTTANYASHFPKQIKELAGGHEIASHTYYHSSFEDKDLAASKIKLEAITGKAVTGLRMPRMREVSLQAVKDAGYTYDSSVNPTWIPGRYNKLSVPRTVFYEQDLLRIPASVSPMRLPLFWLAFKNYPYSFFLHLCKRALQKDNYICLYFHPWEFTEISGYGLPKYTRRPDGEELVKRFEQLISDLKNAGDFVSIAEYLAYF